MRMQMYVSQVRKVIHLILARGKNHRKNNEKKEEMKCTQNNQAISLPLLPGGAAVVRSPVVDECEKCIFRAVGCVLFVLANDRDDDDDDTRRWATRGVEKCERGEPCRLRLSRE